MRFRVAEILTVDQRALSGKGDGCTYENACDLVFDFTCGRHDEPFAPVLIEKNTIIFSNAT